MAHPGYAQGVHPQPVSPYGQPASPYGSGNFGPIVPTQMIQPITSPHRVQRMASPMGRISPVQCQVRPDMEAIKKQLETQVFDMFDTNGNGKLSREELDNAMQMLQQRGLDLTALSNGNGLNGTKSLPVITGQVARPKVKTRDLGDDNNNNGPAASPRGADETKPGFLQCVCGSLFLDDSVFCRKCGSDRSVAEALLEVECNEALFAEELSKLPGGEDALLWLRGVGGEMLPEGWEARHDPNTGAIYYVNVRTGETSTTKPEGKPMDMGKAMARIKESVKVAKAKAMQEAKEQKARAAIIEKSAKDATTMAQSSAMDERHEELEHQMMANLSQKARETEAKAEADAKRLEDAAAKALAEAHGLTDQHREADDHHQHRKGLHMEASQRTAEARNAAGKGLSPEQARQQAAKQQQDAEQRYLTLVQQSERANQAAQTAAEKAKAASVEIHGLQEVCQRGTSGKECLETVEMHVTRAHRAQAHANRLRQKAEVLKQQAQEMLREAEYAEQVALQAEQHAEEQAHIAHDQTAQAKEIGLPEEDMWLTPEAAKEKIERLKAEAAAAEREQNEQSQKAQQLAAAAEEAHRSINDLEGDMEAFDSHDAMQEEEALHKLELDQATARVNAAKAAAEAAHRHAQIAHQRTLESQKKLADQSMAANKAHEKERAAWAKRFGKHGNTCGVCGAILAPDQQVCPQCGQPCSGVKEVPDAANEAQRETERAQQLVAQAHQAEAAAKKAEADAFKLEILVQALEKAKDLGDKLRPCKCECGEQFAEDANFCRSCGRPRMQQWAWDGQTTNRRSIYADGVDKVRQETKASKADIDGLAAKAEAGPPAEEPAKDGFYQVPRPPMTTRSLPGNASPPTRAASPPAPSFRAVSPFMQNSGMSSPLRSFPQVGLPQVIAPMRSASFSGSPLLPLQPAVTPMPVMRTLQ